MLKSSHDRMMSYTVLSFHSMKPFSIFRLLIPPTLTLFLILTTFSESVGITGSDSKKDQIRQLETDLSREKEHYMKFDLKEKNILEKLSTIEKAIE
jgi:hypothetical protein